MVQVGHSNNGVMEDTNSGVNLLSHGTFNPGKQMSTATKREHASKRFTLDAHKLYLDSCVKYHYSFVRWMLGDNASGKKSN